MAMRRVSLVVSIVAALTLVGCGYNKLQAGDEGIKATWAEVLNQYQRRNDLVPNLVNTVKGYAEHEKEVLTQVTEARARVGSVQVSPQMIDDPAAFAKFVAAQNQMTSALSRLLVVSENYPQLKADTGFRDLQAQLEGTENRITVARGRFNDSAQSYNTAVKKFPTNLMAGMFGFKEKPYFKAVTAGAETAPKVNFSFNPTPAPAK
jgi:LemA protein